MAWEPRVSLAGIGVGRQEEAGWKLASIPVRSLANLQLPMDEPTMRCSMTGLPIRDSGDGIWDDGEWVSWAYINEQLARQDAAAAGIDSEPSAQPQGPEIWRLIAEAMDQEEETQAASPLWGKIGELYVAEQYGVILSRDHAQGHDGRLGNDLVEIKTISPSKHRPFVRVKRAGNFSLLAVVRIDEDQLFEVRFLRRDQLPTGEKGLYATVAWSTLCKIGTPLPPPVKA